MVHDPFAPSSILTVDPDEIVHDTIENETIVVALGTGTYYSITGSGVYMWSLASAGIRLEEAMAELRRKFPAQAASIDTVFLDWLSQVVDEGLIKVDGEGEPASTLPEAVDDTEYEAPGFVRYSDMESLILLDPIHEADVGTGWPNRR